jgi:hypothetical protein
MFSFGVGEDEWIGKQLLKFLITETATKPKYSR